MRWFRIRTGQIENEYRELRSQLQTEGQQGHCHNPQMLAFRRVSPSTFICLPFRSVRQGLPNFALPGPPANGFRAWAVFAPRSSLYPGSDRSSFLV